MAGQSDEEKRRVIRQAIMNPDHYGVEMIYVVPDAVSLRIVCPVTFKTSDRWLGVCLGKNQLQAFLVSRIYRIRLVSANQIFPPLRFVKLKRRSQGAGE